MSLDDLQRNIAYTFARRELLEQAVTHPSVRNEQNLSFDNQRMEYLGDAALGLAAAHFLYQNFPDEPEGRLTILRSAATSTVTLADLARDLHIGDVMVLGKGEESSGGRNRDNNLADTLEAVIGAVYLDGGHDAVRRVFEQLFAPVLQKAAVPGQTANPKGLLQEWAQRNGLPCPVYTVASEEGPPHQRWFTVRVKINGTVEEVGAGSTKRAAEADAASRAVSRMSVTG